MLTIVQMQMCRSIDGPMQTNEGGYVQMGMLSERDWPTCTCPAYQFAKPTINFGGRMVKPHCKHILRAQKKACGWHEQFDERQTEEQRENVTSSPR